MSDYPLDSFVFYRSFREAISGLSTKDQLATLLAICDYALYDIEPNLKGVSAAIFTVARPNIDANRKRRSNGKKGGRPKKETSGLENENHRFSENKPNENVNVNETGEGIAPPAADAPTHVEDKPKRKRFVPPTVDEVAAYCQERGNNVDPQRFVDFYSAKGWMVGKNKMKDWKACVRTWEREKNTGSRNDVKSASDYDSGDSFV